MDAKITKKRLNGMLSYDWLKIVGLCAVAVVVWALIFTMTATRITPAQQFTVINYFGNVAATQNKFAETLSNALSGDVFSYEVIEMTMVDVPGSSEYGSQVFEARISTSEGDMIFAPDIVNEGSKYEVTVGAQKETRYDSYLQTLMRNCYSLINLDPNDENGYFKQMEAFLNGYYEGGYINGTLNKAKVEKDFRARIKKNKDKRFKKEAQIQQGVEDEIERIEKYRSALIEFYSYVDSGLVSFTHTVLYDRNDAEKVLREGVYSINLCPNVDTMGGLKEVAGYLKTHESENGGESQKVMTAENMNVFFLQFDDLEKSFEYENLLYVNYLIRLVKTNG